VVAVSFLPPLLAASPAGALGPPFGGCGLSAGGCGAWFCWGVAAGLEEGMGLVLSEPACKKALLAVFIPSLRSVGMCVYMHL